MHGDRFARWPDPQVHGVHLRSGYDAGGKWGRSQEIRVRIRNSRWFWLGCFLFLLVIAMGILAFGYHRYQFERNRPTAAHRIADAAAVTGFVRTAVLDVDDGGHPPEADVYFIGPAPNPAVLTAVSVPTVRLTALDPPPADDERASPGRDHIFVAAGQSEDLCTAASVIFVSNPPLSVHSTWEHGKNRGGEWVPILTASQQAAVRSHTSVLIELSIHTCAW